jgi:2-amino-4-hydroxy-6-hydroxymethyldihydropteridine diphosphokinase
MIRAFVGLGSNRGDREAFLRRAVEELRRMPETRVVRCSSTYDTDPVGDAAAPSYLNAVVELATALPAERLLWHLRLIEARLGRPSRGRKGPRTIDLDLLFYGSSVVEAPGLWLPHPRYTERAFVLVPMVELEPGWTDPRTGLRMDEILRSRRGQDGVRWAGRFR